MTALAETTFEQMGTVSIEADRSPDEIKQQHDTVLRLSGDQFQGTFAEVTQDEAQQVSNLLAYLHEARGDDVGRQIEERIGTVDWDGLHRLADRFERVATGASF